MYALAKICTSWGMSAGRTRTAHDCCTCFFAHCAAIFSPSMKTYGMLISGKSTQSQQSLPSLIDAGAINRHFVESLFRQVRCIGVNAGPKTAHERNITAVTSTRKHGNSSPSTTSTQNCSRTLSSGDGEDMKRRIPGSASAMLGFAWCR